MGLGTQGGFLQPGQELDLAPGPAGGTAVSGVCLWNTAQGAADSVRAAEEPHGDFLCFFIPQERQTAQANLLISSQEAKN